MEECSNNSTDSNSNSNVTIKKEIVEELEITFENNYGGNENFVLPKEELEENSDEHNNIYNITIKTNKMLTEEFIIPKEEITLEREEISQELDRDNLEEPNEELIKPIKVELVMSEEVVQIRHQEISDVDQSESLESQQRVENKAAERSRLYRERHREEINQRRRETRHLKKKKQQIQTLSNIQNINETGQIELATLNNQLRRSFLNTQRQKRYYERHREEINKRKRDSRLKQNNSQVVPATAAERSRSYRERNRLKINEQRRASRRQQNAHRANTQCYINNTDIDPTTGAQTNNQQNYNSSDNYILQKVTQTSTSALQPDTYDSIEETNSAKVQKRIPAKNKKFTNKKRKKKE